MGAIQLALFETVKSFVINSRDLDFDVNTLLAEAVFGSIGGAVGALISTPGDIITIQLMAGLERDNDEDVSTLSGSGNSASGALVAVPQGGSALDAALKVYEERGIRAFFEGAKERVLYWSVAISIFLSVYCSLRRYAMDIM